MRTTHRDGGMDLPRSIIPRRPRRPPPPLQSSVQTTKMRRLSMPLVSSTVSSSSSGERRQRRMMTVQTRAVAMTTCGAIGLDELAWFGTTAYALACVWACKAASTKPRREDATAVSERAASFVSSLRMFAPMCALYGFLLYRSWTPETLSLMMPGSLEEGLATGKVQFIPTLSSISTLLGARATATSAWAHLLCVNVFVARHVALKTRERFERDGRAPPVAHTLALTALAGPLGLLAYALTCFVYDAWSRRSPPLPPLNLQSRDE
jgi:hypothetical protein